MAEDVSNRTVVILVVLTIIISTLGTLTVSSSVSSFKAGQVPTVEESTTQTAKIGLRLASPGEASEVPQVPQVNSVTGNVALDIS